MVNYNYQFSKDIDDESLFREMVEFTGNISSYTPGNRNNFLFKLACNINKRGLKRDLAERMIRENYPDLLPEIKHIVNSAYSYIGEHGMYSQAG